MLLAPIVAGKGFTKYDADMNGVGTVACTEYFYRGRTSRFLELLETK